MVLCGSVAWLQARAVGLGNANGSTGMLRCVQWWVIFDFAVLILRHVPCAAFRRGSPRASCRS